MQQKTSAEQAIASVMPLIHKLANKYQTVSVLHDDLVQEGQIAAFKAWQAYVPNSNCKFATYAYKYILNAIIKCFMVTCTTIRVPQYMFSVKGADYRDFGTISINSWTSSDSVASSSDFSGKTITRLWFEGEISKMSAIERSVTLMRFQDGMQMKEIAPVINYSYNGVRKICDRVIKSMRASGYGV